MSSTPLAESRPRPGTTFPSAAGRFRRCSELDVLRLLAALSVVGFHWLFRSATGSDPLATTGFEGVAEYFRYGYLGVDVFFVISGFVILRSAWGRSPGVFLLNRAGRLYPAFWAACTLTALAVTVLPGDRHAVTFGQWAANLTMGSEAFGVTYVDGVYWTLLVELAFYGLVAIGAAFGLTANRVLAGAGIWLAISVAHHYAPMSTGWGRLFVPEWAPYFVAGVGFALLATDGPGTDLSRRQRWAAVVLTVLSCVWAVRLGVSFAGSLTAKYDVEFSGVVVASVLLATFAVFVLLVNGVTVPGAARVAFLGALTYPLYLVHENIGYSLLTLGNERLGLNRWVVLVIVAALVVALASALHRFVEDPAGRRVSGWTKRLAKRRRQHTRRPSLPDLWRRTWRAVPTAAPRRTGHTLPAVAPVSPALPGSAALRPGPEGAAAPEPRELAAYAGFTAVSRTL
ncbi:acyltransferase family protein [Cryptosporangium arvum]|uniref:acyltransferase family protein n=1 Tax=Cryptosporangium arvum TaxID=80871 RepID=UPI0004AF4F7B|nr:acyltransferase family protein [Cryptosporangium arvum]